MDACALEYNEFLRKLKDGQMQFDFPPMAFGSRPEDSEHNHDLWDFGGIAVSEMATVETIDGHRRLVAVLVQQHLNAEQERVWDFTANEAFAVLARTAGAHLPEGIRARLPGQPTNPLTVWFTLVQFMDGPGRPHRTFKWDILATHPFLESARIIELLRLDKGRDEAEAAFIKRFFPGSPEGQISDATKPIDPVTTEARREILAAMRPSQRKAYLSYKLIEAKLGPKNTDEDAYQALREEDFSDDHRDLEELTDYNLPRFNSWARYLRDARCALGEQKYSSRSEGSATQRRGRQGATLIPPSGPSTSVAPRAAH